MPLTVPPQAVAQVAQLAQALSIAPHGQKSALYQAAALRLGVSRGTLSRWVGEVAVRSPRKRRADAGTSALPRAEAEFISAALIEAMRRNGKRLLAIGQALDMLRASELIRAERIDADGVIRPLSNSAIIRALRAYGLHPDTLLRPAPAMSLASLHPNHVWQIDASLCVLYYLPRQAGLQVMDADKFYKNKPANAAKIAQDRVWRYAITDHASGHVYVQYVLGAESGENLADTFIAAIQKRADEPVHGVPLLVMLDPGSANTGALFQNLCRALQVRVIINEVGNPRAKGQVEKAHDLIERSFESRLKFVDVRSLDDLNAAAAKWRRWFNGSRVMARHGMTRDQAWLKITADVLRIAPGVDVCRELTTSAPESRKVNDRLQVSFGGRLYDVSGVPAVQNRDTVMVCRNPWRPDCAQVIAADADGREVYYVIEPVARGEWGFAQGAPVIAQDHKRHADTPAQRATKALEKLAMDAATLDEAAGKRKAKALPFGGRVKPWQDIETGIADLPTYLPKRGTPLETPLPGIAAAPDAMTVPAALVIDPARLSHVQMAAALSRRMPWSTEAYARMAVQWPTGCTEAELGAVQAALQEAGRAAA